MNSLWLNIIEQSLGKVQRSRPLSGGDTSSIYQIELESTTVIAKTNSASGTPDLLKAEQLGLAALAQHGIVATPKVQLYEQHTSGELLIMEYVPAGEKTTKALRAFGQQMARLHQISIPTFGWEHANYIGKLPQSNSAHPNWPQFYAHERLQPQLRLAIDAGLLSVQDAPTAERTEEVCNNFLGLPRASPLHGDLWAGNYLIDQSGKAYIIDPSFYYGHAEIDLAMSRLFGGFGPSFYEGYHEIIPLQAGAEDRRDIYQLYYLLVHLNMFGRSYLSSVQHILNRYFLTS